MNNKKLIVTTALIMLFSYPCTIEAQYLKLRYVIDGDTVKFTKNITCRLAYIDTPESKPNKKAKRDYQKHSDILNLDDIIRSGRIASNYLKSILQKGEYYSIESIGKDKYERDICLIYYEKKIINEKIISDGFGVPFYKYIPYRLKSKYKNLYKKAKENNKGLWRIYPNVLESMGNSI